MKFTVGPTSEEQEQWPQTTYTVAGNEETSIALDLAENYWNLDVEVITNPSSEKFVVEHAAFVERLGNTAMKNIADSRIYTGTGNLIKIISEKPDPDPEVAPVVRKGRYLSAPLFLDKVGIVFFNKSSGQSAGAPAIKRSDQRQIIKPKKTINLKPNFDGALANLEAGKTRGLDGLLKRGQV